MPEIGADSINNYKGYNPKQRLQAMPSAPCPQGMRPVQRPLPVYCIPPCAAAGYAAQPYVSVSTPNSRQIYQYPQASVYNAADKKAASGLNIYVFNPSGASSNGSINNNCPVQESSKGAAIANTPLAKEETKKQDEKKNKHIVKLTDDYIKTLESFLRSPDETVRKQAVTDLIQRFEEDDERYDDKALTALLNIALQDPKARNRRLALGVIDAGKAHGDETTVKILKGLAVSDNLYGQEAQMASQALLKTSYTRQDKAS